jgi:uncharacterized membrane protein (UPF0127 family)
MKQVRLVNQTQSKVLCPRCAVADNLLTRVRGLLGRTSLAEDEGLLIIPCPSIHMFGMKFSLDVVFLSKENVVVDWVENIEPGKLYVAQTPPESEACAPPIRPADATVWKKTYAPHAAIELAAGSIVRHGLQRFDHIAIET